jgi:hypothetical protein
MATKNIAMKLAVSATELKITDLPNVNDFCETFAKTTLSIALSLTI